MPKIIKMRKRWLSFSLLGDTRFNGKMKRENVSPIKTFIISWMSVFRDEFSVALMPEISGGKGCMRAFLNSWMSVQARASHL